MRKNGLMILICEPAMLSFESFVQMLTFYSNSISYDQKVTKKQGFLGIYSSQDYVALQTELQQLKWFQ